MLLTTLVLHLLLGRYMVAAEVGARAATKGSMANGGRNSVWISASGSLGTVSVGRRYAAAARLACSGIVCGKTPRIWGTSFWHPEKKRKKLNVAQVLHLSLQPTPRALTRAKQNMEKICSRATAVLAAIPAVKKAL